MLEALREPTTWKCRHNPFLDLSINSKRILNFQKRLKFRLICKSLQTACENTAFENDLLSHIWLTPCLLWLQDNLLFVTLNHKLSRQSFLFWWYILRWLLKWNNWLKAQNEHQGSFIWRNPHSALPTYVKVEELTFIEFSHLFFYYF